MYFHFNVDPAYLNASTPDEISIVTFIQMYESIAQHFVKIDKNDHVSKNMISDSIKQIVEILSEIKKWEVNEKFHNMKIDYINIMKDHYETLMKDTNND